MRFWYLYDFCIDLWLYFFTALTINGILTKYDYLYWFMIICLYSINNQYNFDNICAIVCIDLWFYVFTS